MIDRPDNVNIYLLYASEDEPLRRELEDHLGALQRLGYVDIWHEGLVEAGADKDAAVAEYLHRAHIILLLISANFLSPDCYGRYEGELRVAYDRQRRGEVKIVPVILRHCMWQMDILAQLNPLPRGGHPVRSRHWESEDVAFHEIALELRNLAEELRRAAEPAQAPAPAAEPASVPHEAAAPAATASSEAAAPPRAASAAAAREASAPAPSIVEPAAAGEANGRKDGPWTREPAPEALIGGLLEILCTLRAEEGVQRFRDLAHGSLYAGREMDPAFRRNNFAPACERGRLYRRPPLITAWQPTGRRHIGGPGGREAGEEVKFTIARNEDVGGLGGHVRIFYPADGGAPTICGLTL